MSDNVIKFHSFHPSNNTIKDYRPAPVKKHMPKWFVDKEKFKKQANGMFQLVTYVDTEGKTSIHRQPSWKSCPALLDIFMSGYYMFTPCDITFKKSETNPYPDLEYDEKWGYVAPAKSFVAMRGAEEGLPCPEGYNEYTFVWRINWYFEVPKGNTILFTHPLNIVDLPFQTISGFADASNPHMISGNYPFYIKKDWYGTIPAGTPFVQIIPMKAEEWSSEIHDYTQEEIQKQVDEKYKEYVVGHGITKYKELDWIRKRYE
jgi:hypothetical protein